MQRCIHPATLTRADACRDAHACDAAVHEQRDPSGQRGLIGRQAREQVEQGLVTGAVADQEPILDGPDSFPHLGKVGQSGVERGRVPARQLT